MWFLWGTNWISLSFRSGDVTGLDSREYDRRNPSRWPRGTLYAQKLTLTSPTSGGRSVGIVHLRNKATEWVSKTQRKDAKELGRANVTLFFCRLPHGKEQREGLMTEGQGGEWVKGLTLIQSLEAVPPTSQILSRGIFHLRFHSWPFFSVLHYLLSPPPLSSVPPQFIFSLSLGCTP
jgi:hypothetical protein